MSRDVKVYSVALVFQNAESSKLRVTVTAARSDDEALGKAIGFFKNEVRGLGLVMHNVINISEALPKALENHKIEDSKED